MKKIIFIVLSTLMLLAACGQSDEAEETSGDSKDLSLVPVEVEILTEDELDLGTQTLSASVSHNDELVNDAEEVEFEVWEQGSKEESQMLAAENSGEGEYTVDYEFEEDGVYHIQYHVTARDQHVMPKHEVKVGDAETSHHEEEDEHANHHSSTVQVELNSHWVEDELILTSKITNEDKTLEAAEVTYEITSQDDENLHEWIAAEENDAGNYEASFEHEGLQKLTINVHIKTENLHEHIEKSISKY
ncbi:hypothetical protein CEY16_06830 [Halalkalibacillus sediminis]|uniref:YtkA-like domain-containing protein n=1 Tax=Halalkalibacillus sediminis TaxID=2018042 RepID=A0A2I0QTL4_9BACI|nr:FixH family protein [Halalkalibacillus sediminis]PKR77644.1 hypothetical protein CEY16_06830 [Halalkalibacillus sediminis]